jgi:hypothetical protein
MKHSKNSNCRLSYGIGGYIGRTIDNEFACPGDSTHAPTGWKIEQTTGGGDYPFIDQNGGCRIVASMYVKMASRSDNANPVSLTTW